MESLASPSSPRLLQRPLLCSLGSQEGRRSDRREQFDTLCRDGSINGAVAIRLLGDDLVEKLVKKNITSPRADSKYVVHLQHVLTMLRSLGFGKPRVAIVAEAPSHRRGEEAIAVSSCFGCSDSACAILVRVAVLGLKSAL